MNEMPTLGIHPDFEAFLKRLANKKEGEPLLLWQESIDFLDAFIGDGDCREYMLGGWCAEFLDITLKLNPEDGEDPFVGFHISGGIRACLRRRYKEQLGSRYDEFKIHHNQARHEYHASELFELWLQLCPVRKPDEIARIRQALLLQNPSTHIPL
jgi:hypothetical protein